MAGRTRWFARPASTARRDDPGREPPPGWAAVAPAVRSALAAVPGACATVLVPQRLPPVPVGQEALEQALTAMVRSAWLRTPPGARVLVAAAAASGPPGEPGVLRIQVTDRGPDLPGAAKAWMLAGVHGSESGLSTAVRRLTAAGAGRIVLADNPAGGLVRVLTVPLAAHR